MIDFHNVTKSFPSSRGTVNVLTGLTLSLPRDRNIAIIGRNGAGKSTLMSMIAGTSRPVKGTIVRHGRVSWPLGFSGGFHPALTGRQNARFVARIYGVNTDDVVDYVADFAQLGRHFDLPVRTYSQGMKARLAFGVSMAASFDCYLVDEIIGVGDATFKAKCKTVFESKLHNSRVIMVSHSEGVLRSFCQSALLLDSGHATYFENLEDGLAAYNQLIAA